jgi:hypothetical protein
MAKPKSKSLEAEEGIYGSFLEKLERIQTPCAEGKDGYQRY